MGDAVDREMSPELWRYRQFVGSLQAIAMAAGEQISLFPTQANVVSELISDFSIWDWAIANNKVPTPVGDDEVMPNGIHEKLVELCGILRSIYEDATSDWSAANDALFTDQRWEQARSVAADVLRTLGWNLLTKDELSQ